MGSLGRFEIGDGKIRDWGTEAICTKNCEDINKWLTKVFEKKCPEQVCKNEKIKPNLQKQFDNKVKKAAKKLGCEDTCISIFEKSEDGHDHEDAHDSTGF